MCCGDAAAARLGRAPGDPDSPLRGGILAIPHNGNLSNGLMFSVETNDGKPLTKELAALRMSLEPIVEATQIKGDSESHPFLSPNDEFADYELWDKSNLDGTEVKKHEMFQYEYVRAALKNGLALEKKLGINPFKVGMASGTDAHTALPAVEEENFFGKHSGVEPEPHRWEHVVIKSPVDPSFTTHGWQMAAAGYTGVWGGDREPGADEKLPPVGNTVDVKNATWTNTIGAPELIAVWTDPEFDPTQSAFYYVRVIEIPTPRWTAYEAKRFGVTMPGTVPMVTQERAYTSPIWYTP